MATNRRPVTRQPKSAPAPKPEDIEPMETVPPVVSNETTIPVEQEAVTTPTEEVYTAEDTSALDDTSWEQMIEQAKAEADAQLAGVVTPADVFKNPAPTVVEKKEVIVEQVTETTVSVDNDAIEQEVQRRVAEQLAAKTVVEPAVTPVLPTTPIVVAEPSEADLKKQEDISTKNDVSAYVHCALGDADDFEAAFTAAMENDPRPDSAKTSEPTPYVAGLSLTNQLGVKNNQHSLLAKWLGEIIEKNANAINAVTKELRLARVTPKIGDGTGPKKLSGATAKAAVISKLKGMYRVHLYNSGFWIDLRPAELLDVDSWMQEVDTDFSELGRVMGGHAHSVLDIFLKQKFFDILPGLVQRSNFSEYANADKLIDNISYHDYDTLLWAMCCMYYKDGIGAGIYCTNPECMYIDDHQYIDLRNICFTNDEAFNTEAQQWMMRGARAGGPILTEGDLKQYREQVLKHNKTIELLDGTTVFTLGVPTVRRYVEESLNLVTKLQGILNGNHDVKNDLVSNQLTYHLYRMLLPWIQSLDIKDEQGNLVYHIEDREAIYEALSIDTYEDSTLYDQVADYIRDTKCSMYSATTLKCPKCGKAADLEHDNMLPFDMQYLFFCLSCRQLEQTGASF